MGEHAFREEEMVVSGDAALDTVGHSTYPDGRDAEESFLGIVWWVNQKCSTTAAPRSPSSATCTEPR